MDNWNREFPLYVCQYAHTQTDTYVAHPSSYFIRVLNTSLKKSRLGVTGGFAKYISCTWNRTSSVCVCVCVCVGVWVWVCRIQDLDVLILSKLKSQTKSRTIIWQIPLKPVC